MLSADSSPSFVPIHVRHDYSFPLATSRPGTKQSHHRTASAKTRHYNCLAAGIFHSFVVVVAWDRIEVCRVEAPPAVRTAGNRSRLRRHTVAAIGCVRPYSVRLMVGEFVDGRRWPRTCTAVVRRRDAQISPIYRWILGTVKRQLAMDYDEPATVCRLT